MKKYFWPDQNSFKIPQLSKFSEQTVFIWIEIFQIIGKLSFGATALALFNYQNEISNLP